LQDTNVIYLKGKGNGYRKRCTYLEQRDFYLGALDRVYAKGRQKDEK
jgi:hypothetical protein